jgi:hypothetical protein
MQVAKASASFRQLLEAHDGAKYALTTFKLPDLQ